MIMVGFMIVIMEIVFEFELTIIKNTDLFK